MSNSNLVKMANQIGSFFETMKDHDEALKSIAGHIRSYWDPRMRYALLEHVEQHGGTDLLPLVLEAVNRHHKSLASNANAHS